MGDNKNFVKEITNIDEDFAKWYTDIVLKAELADYTETKGCITIRPYGYAIWENIQKILDGTETAEEKVGKILEQALERGGRDNVTLVLAQISGYEEKNILKRWAERHSTGR